MRSIKTRPAATFALGFSAGFNLTTGGNNMVMGNAGVAGEAPKIRIGKQGSQNGTFIAGIFGVTMTGSPVLSKLKREARRQCHFDSFQGGGQAHAQSE